MTDPDVIKQMRKKFTPENGVNLLLDAVTKIAQSVGVHVVCEPISYKPTLDRDLFQQGIREVASSIGALSAGVKLNPINLAKGMFDANDPTRVSGRSAGPSQKSHETGNSGPSIPRGPSPDDRVG